MSRITNNIDNIKDCYGCGVCAIVCPKNIIEIGLNNSGFYAPLINNIESCIGCGLCLDVCSFTKDRVVNEAQDIQCYAGWSTDESIRKACSSGGIGFAIAKHLINRGYKACGVKYNVEKNRAEHFIANTVEAFLPSIGSKYIQSYTPIGFSHINRKDMFFITGTPCQIDSIRRYIRKMNIENNFILLDFFCHGVPSIQMWNKYLENIKKITGDVLSLSWRNKTTGWHDSWVMTTNRTEINWHDSYGLKIREKKTNYFSPMSKGDLFYKFFLGDCCLNKACYHNCKYKMKSSAADIRIGDLWGTKYKANQEGVSAVIALTDVGKNIISEMENCCFISEPLEVVTEGQMKGSPKHHYYYNIISSLLKTPISLKSIYFFIQLCQLPNRVLNKIVKILKIK